MFIKNPNLPTKKITSAIISEEVSDDICNQLVSYKINIKKTQKQNKVLSSVNSHPDMQFLYLGQGRVFCDGFSENYFNKNDFNIKILDSDISEKFPNDIFFNVCIMGDYAVCYKNSKIIDKLSDKKIIKVNQGYAKCSILPVSLNSLITDDESIFKEMKSSGFDVLLVKKGSISLKGLNYGFIGGTGGLIDKDKMFFFGDILAHSDAQNIKSFLRNYGVYAISSAKNAIYDYGSLIQLTEENDD